MTTTRWGSEDPTEPQPRPVDPRPVHHCPECRNDCPVAVVVLLTFALGAIAMLGTIYSLNATVEHLMQTPMCQEPK